MTAAPPPRDSVLDALGYAVRILTKPGFLWAPVLLYLVLMIPLIPLYSLGVTTPPPTVTTPEEMNALLQRFIPTIAATVIVSIIITPIASAVAFRLSQQYVDGEPPEPFGPGIATLAWRFFLQTWAITLLVFVALLVVVIVFAVLQAIAGTGFAILMTAIGGCIAYVYFILRLGLSQVLLLSGAGPIEAIRRSWELTRGHLARVFRWLFVSTIVVGIAAAVVGGVVGAVFAGFGQAVIGQVVGTILAAPLGLVGSIVLVLLARLLSSPLQPPRPAPALPDWMNPGGPTGEPPSAPST